MWSSIVRWTVPIAALIGISLWLYISPPGLKGKLDAVGYAVCHRIESRSLHIGSLQMPLCARCTGEFNAAAIALVFQIIVSPRKSLLPRRSILVVFTFLFLAFAVDGSNSYLALIKSTRADILSGIPILYTTNNVTRVLTGSGMGLLMASLLYPVYNQSIWQAPRRERAIEWPQFGLLAGIVVLLDMGMLAGNKFILYSAAFLSALGVLMLLSLIFSIGWIMVMKQDNIFDHVRQLWLPTTAGITIAFLLIVTIDLFRLNLTHTWGGFPGLTG